MRRPAAILTLTLLGIAVCTGHYNYIQYQTRTGPWTPIPQKFDLNALINRSVPFFITEQAPAQMAAGDSLAAVVSEVRAAAAVWNGVETSDLRIAFGGYQAGSVTQNGPGIDVVFDDVPPGIVAMGGPTSLLDSNGAFVPIQRSVLRLNRDLSQRPSYSEAFFGTVLHEFGHALGLQHSLASGAMSTSITRSTTRGNPLAADDIAGISALYPARNFASSTGVIAGRVSLNNQGVHLASVVAIQPNGAAVSAFTNPDGSYRIEGVPPGQYLVYAHPLPPALTSQSEVTPANITYPLDADRRPIAPGGAFETVFYPGVKDPQQAFSLSVSGGSAIEGIDFQVRSRGALQLHSVQTYGFPGNLTVKPPFLNPLIARPFLVASGNGLVTNNNPAPGLSVAVLSGAGLNLRPYAVDARFAQMDVDVRSFSFSNAGPRHLLFSLANDIYVLPAGFFQVNAQPPSLASIARGTDGSPRSVVITGSRLSPETKVMFDGAAANVRDFDESAGRLLVTAPPAVPGHRAAVVLVNPDGQSSLFVQSEPGYFTYEAADASAGSPLLNTGTMPAGVEAMIQVDGGDFDATSTIGFGSSDVIVRRVWAVSSNRLVANVSIARTAALASLNMTVSTGLRVVTQPFALTVISPSAQTIWFAGQPVNALSAQRALTPGANAVVTVNAPASTLASQNLSLTLNDAPAVITGVQGSQVTFTIPANTPSGPAVLRLRNGSDQGLPLAVQIEPPPPQITAASIGNSPVESARPARSGDLLTLLVAGLTDSGTAVPPSRVQVSVADIECQVLVINSQKDGYHVSVLIPSGVSNGTANVTITIDGRQSQPYSLSVRP